MFEKGTYTVASRLLNLGYKASGVSAWVLHELIFWMLSQDWDSLFIRGIQLLQRCLRKL